MEHLATQQTQNHRCDICNVLRVLSSCFEQIGYKEGAYAGRQSVFQHSFDDGYAAGFRNGLQLGRYQGLTTAFAQINADSQPSTSSTDLLLLKPTRGQCQVCTDQLLINRPVDDLVRLQGAHEAKCRIALETKYAHIERFCGVHQTNTP